MPPASYIVYLIDALNLHFILMTLNTIVQQLFNGEALEKEEYAYI